MTDADRLLDAALFHVPFDGWSDDALNAAARDNRIDPEAARALFPRGGVDLALAYHKRGDAAMVARLGQEDLSALRFRDRIARAVRIRLDVVDKELVRRGMTLFSLPGHAGDGAKAMWETCGLIWESLGDTSVDINWYTKRATLSAVYGSTVLFWLGDESIGHQATWEFLDRRIDNVMQFETFKGRVRGTRLWDAFMAGPGKILDEIRPPGQPRADYPGHWDPKETKK